MTLMVTPEDYLKFQIESQLDMAGLNVATGKPMRELVDAIFQSPNRTFLMESLEQCNANGQHQHQPQAVHHEPAFSIK